MICQDQKKYQKMFLGQDRNQQAYKYIILKLKTENLFGLIINILKMLSFS